jgi:predicted Zn-dependent peptidase
MRSSAPPAPRLLAILILLLLPWAAAQDQLKENIYAYTLSNGLRVIMVVRDFAPVIDFNLTFDVGGVDEPEGLGGIAHMVEHMAFKGTRSIGSYDIRAEEKALEALELAASALKVARDAGATGEALAAFEEDFAAAKAAAQALASPNALDALFTDNGAQSLNASTAYDRTSYTVSLPANRLELYARVYADVLTNPVFRSFYEERDVVREERRQRSEDSPEGVLYEAFLAEAFQEHPYGRPLIGAVNEIEGYTATAARGIFEVFYHPNRAVLVLVGDVQPERDIRLIRRYFEFVPRGPVVRAEIPAEPPQRAERRVEVPFAAEPQLVVGFQKPTYPNRAAYVADVLDYILGRGRTSRLYRALVTEQQLAADVSTSSATPGTRYPNLFTVELQPRAPHTPRDLETALYRELARVAEVGVTDAELRRAKTLLRADVLRSFESGAGLAATLAYNELFAGGWENLFDDLDTYDTVTAAEIEQLAGRIFRAPNRTVATLVTQSGAARSGEADADTQEGQ